eukprot:766041-Ditylum_brightwellii.AAC.1
MQPAASKTQTHFIKLQPLVFIQYAQFPEPQAHEYTAFIAVGNPVRQSGWFCIPDVTAIEN